MMSFFTSGVAQIIDVLFIFGATLFSLVGKDFPLVLQEKPGAFFTEGKDTRTPKHPSTSVVLVDGSISGRCAVLVDRGEEWEVIKYP